MKSNGRSINFSVMTRGMEALRLIDVDMKAKEKAVLFSSRTVHLPNETIYQPNGIGNVVY